MQHFIGFVQTPAGAVACMALAVVVTGLVVDYALAKHERHARSRTRPANELMREHRRRRNAEHDALDRNIGWS